jgi:hypothetical protein
MANNRKIEEYIENNLRRSSLIQTSEGFTNRLMQKVTAENRSAVEEIKRERIAKYIITFFISMTLGVTVIIGYLTGGEVNSKIESTNVRIEPTIETSSGYIHQFVNFIASSSVSVLHFLGLTATPKTLNIILYLLGVFILYIIADRIFIRGRLKSSHG